MDSAAHRKIELQYPEDFSYLVDNVRRAAADSVDAAFPPVAGGGGGQKKDDLHARIEELVDEYIRKIFTLASPNLTINGLDIDPAPFLGPPPSSLTTPERRRAAAAQAESFEPFDSRKRGRVEELAREEEDLLREIAALKRKVPAAAAARWAESVSAGIWADEEALGAAREAAIADPGRQRGGAEEGGPREGRESMVELAPLERQEDVEASFAAAVRGLGRIKREMPATVARMERARVAG